MLKQILIFLSFLLSITFAKVGIASPRQHVNDFVNSQNQEQLESVQREQQQLIGRVESLEHVVKQLNEQIHALKETGNKIEEHPQPYNTKEAVLPADVMQEDNHLTAPASHSHISGNSEKQDYDLALAALKENNLPEAMNRFNNFIRLYPKSLLSSNSFFWYGEACNRSKMYDKAALYYLKSYKQSPKGAKANEALLKLAATLGELKKAPEACSMLNKLDKEFPNRPPTSVKRTEELRKKLRCK